jgi:NADH-quinone oxidoreductase subunit H
MEGSHVNFILVHVYEIVEGIIEVFFQAWGGETVYYTLISSAVSTLIPLLVAIAYYTLAERKVMASIQRRKGPNVVGIWGLLQPLADGLKLVIKEIIIPRRSNVMLFIFAPVLTFTLSLIT